MVPAASTIFLRAAPVIQTPTPGVGPSELTDYWPVVVRGGWFLAGFFLVFVLGWFLLTPLVSRVVRRRNRNNPTLNEAIARYVRLFVALIALIVGVGMAGYGGFLGNSALVVAAATLALGVAGQTVIGSLVSGIALVVDPQFNVGDTIEWEDNRGTVQSITLRVTRVLTPDGELVTVPNETLTAQAVRRPFGQGRYRVVHEVQADYGADLGETLAILESTAAEQADIAEAPSPRAYVTDFGSDAVVLTAHYWVADPDGAAVLSVRSNYARSVKRRLDEAGIDISPPAQQELSGLVRVSEVT